MVKQKSTNQRGFILPVLLFTITLIITLLAFVGSLSLTTYNLSTREAYKVNAQLAADAGLDVGIHEFNMDNSWAGTSGEVTLLDSPGLRTTYETHILPGASTDQRIVSVTARTYSPSSSTTPKITRRYEVDLRAITSGVGPSSVVSGVGGLIMESNAKITGGDVVVNGTIELSSNAQIGLSSTPVSNAVNVRVPHMNCPSPVTSAYPRLCGTGENGEPITIGTNAKIYGDVKANNQTNGANMSNPGLTASSGVEEFVLPDYDRTAHKNSVTVANTYNASDPSITCGANQTKSWPAVSSLKIVGDVTLGPNCKLTIKGNVWITGRLRIRSNARIIVDNALGTTMPVFMIDGQDGLLLDSNGVVQPNSTGIGIYFITYWSSACSIGGETPPDCSNITGSALKNSQNTVTIHLDSNGSAPGSILYARWSRVFVESNGAIGAVAGQSIQLGSNAVINFTASLPGSDNLTVTWVKRGYMRVFE